MDLLESRLTVGKSVSRHYSSRVEDDGELTRIANREQREVEKNTKGIQKVSVQKVNMRYLEEFFFFFAINADVGNEITENDVQYHRKQ